MTMIDPCNIPPLSGPPTTSIGCPDIHFVTEVLCDLDSGTCFELVKKFDACLPDEPPTIAYLDLAGNPIAAPTNVGPCNSGVTTELLCDTTVVPALPVMVSSVFDCAGNLVSTSASLLSGAPYAGAISLLSTSCTEAVGSVLCEIDATGALIDQWLVVAIYGEGGNFLFFDYRNLATGAAGNPNPANLRYCSVDSDHEQEIMHECVAGVCVEFMRHYYYRNGLLLTVYDTQFDGLTPYVTGGFPIGAGSCPARDRFVELVYDALPSGDCVSVELVKTFDCTGTASVAYLDLTGLPYVPVGTLSTECPCPPSTPLGVIADWAILSA
jgi:hypothetical protein